MHDLGWRQVAFIVDRMNKEGVTFFQLGYVVDYIILIKIKQFFFLNAHDGCLSQRYLEVRSVLLLLMSSHK